ncbi:protein mono-ADP-ribosyltransferase PARP12 [Trichomycterus rosablanca]|uniref:protein mono-ADP-ribosyltransferase PARP12 n=1 Tax=Trichomycterus rosablanca TaxID=2290929 RepID=UPI002F359601
MEPETIIKLICANRGSMIYDELISNFNCDVDGVIERNEWFVIAWLNGQKTVIARSEVKLCRAKDCNGCMKLHLCKFYLFGDCRYGRGRRGCRFSHDLTSEQNAKVLKQYGLSQLNKEELCVLLLQSDTILPPVCFSYNNGTGPYGRCQDGENCKRLHICERYLREPCQCPRAHDFYEPHPLKTLQDRGVPTELMPSMKTLYSNIEAVRKTVRNKPAYHNANRTAKMDKSSGQKDRKDTTGQQQTSNNYANSAEKTELCMYFVKGFCKHGEKCFKEHSKVPYKWEVNTGLWQSISDNEGIEKDYCNPAKTHSSGINFDTLTFGSYPVRRLSTVSSVLQPTFILTTNWAWYWEDEYGNWIQYASSNGGHNLASINREDLEQKFLENNKAELEFTAGSQTYILSFQDMLQTNKRYGTKKLVKRRPTFVSAADAQRIRTSKPAPANQMKSLPSHWNKALTPETGYKRVPLQSDSSEYMTVQRLFNSTMHGFSIQQIERVQNRSLWEVFQWQKDHMKKNNSGRDATEKQLFHGTDSKHIDAICLNNFDWRICGTHGTAYGRGSYFARDAKYSHNYTGEDTTRCMFICRVLVGDYTAGSSSYLRPPSKDGGDTIFYDSCVDNLHSPSIFVVFEKHQIYPEYLIKYQEGSLLSPSNYRPAPVVNRVNPVQPATPRYQPNQSSVTYSSSSFSSSLYQTPTPSYSRSPSPAKSKPDNSCVIS